MHDEYVYLHTSEHGPELELSTLGCSSTHNNAQQDLQRTVLGPTPPKTGPDIQHPDLGRALSASDESY